MIDCYAMMNRASRKDERVDVPGRGSSMSKNARTEKT